MSTKQLTAANRDHYSQEQRYHLFLDKMLQLYRAEKRAAKKTKRAYKRMEMAPMSSHEPIKKCL